MKSQKEPTRSLKEPENPKGTAIRHISEPLPRFRALIRRDKPCVNINMNVEQFTEISEEYTQFIYRQIENASTLFAILTPGCFDKIMNNYAEYGDNLDHYGTTEWLEQELTVAFSFQIRVIPISLPGFQWPESRLLPPNIRQITKQKGLRWTEFNRFGTEIKWQDKFIEYAVRRIENDSFEIEDDMNSVYSRPDHRKFSDKSLKFRNMNRNFSATSSRTSVSTMKQNQQQQSSPPSVTHAASHISLPQSMKMNMNLSQQSTPAAVQAMSSSQERSRSNTQNSSHPQAEIRENGNQSQRYSQREETGINRKISNATTESGSVFSKEVDVKEVVVENHDYVNDVRESVGQFSQESNEEERIIEELKHWS